MPKQRNNACAMITVCLSFEQACESSPAMATFATIASVLPQPIHPTLHIMFKSFAAVALLLSCHQTLSLLTGAASNAAAPPGAWSN